MKQFGRDGGDVPHVPEVDFLAVDLHGRSAAHEHHPAVGPAQPDGIQPLRPRARDEVGVDAAANRPLDHVEVEVRRHTPSVDEAGRVAESLGQRRRLRPAAVDDHDARLGLDLAQPAPQERHALGIRHERAADLDEGNGFFGHG